MGNNTIINNNNSRIKKDNDVRLSYSAIAVVGICPDELPEGQTYLYTKRFPAALLIIVKKVLEIFTYTKCRRDLKKYTKISIRIITGIGLQLVFLLFFMLLYIF